MAIAIQTYAGYICNGEIVLTPNMVGDLTDQEFAGQAGVCVMTPELYRRVVEVGHLVVPAVLEVAKTLPPEEFKAWFCGGLITNVVGNLPEDYWAKMMPSEPCDKVGCNCHKFGAMLMPVLDVMRTDHYEHLPKETAE